MDGIDGQELWCLQLLTIEDDCHRGLDLISDSCKSLKSTMEILSTKFFGLKGGDRRLIDFCRSSPGPFNRQLAERLVEGCFLSILSNSLTSTNGSIVEIDEKAVSKVRGGLHPLMNPVLDPFSSKRCYISPHSCWPRSGLLRLENCGIPGWFC